MPETNEIWKPCSKYPEYEVSTQGNIRKSEQHIYAVYDDCETLIKVIPPQLVKRYINRDTNYVVTLGTFRHINVHRLVAMTFLNDYTDNCIVKHIDGNNLNNCVENLECISYSDYIKNKTYLYNCVKCVTTGQYFSSVKSASKYFSIPYGQLKKYLEKSVNNWPYKYDFIPVSKDEVKKIINTDMFINIDTVNNNTIKL